MFRIKFFSYCDKSTCGQKTGKFTYSEADVNKDDPKFVKEGTITVNGNPSSNSINTSSDTVAFFMIRAKDLDTHVSQLKSKELMSLINILSKIYAEDKREQVLIISAGLTLKITSI